MRSPTRRLTPSDRRLLVGYGPAVVLGVGFLLMAALLPSVAPERLVAESNQASGPGAGDGAAATVETGTPTSTAAPGAAGPASGAAHTSSCGAGVPQVKGDPYSPPCIQFSGSNGGSTSRGVTKDTIKITYRVPADALQNYEAAITQLAAKYGTTQYVDTEADIERTLDDVVTYFNRRFQFYGRKLELVRYNGQGQLAQEVLGGGQAQATADSINVASKIGAFADISAVSQPYAEALSAKQVVNIGAPYMSQPWFQQRAPYAWSLFPDCTGLSNAAAEVVNKQVFPYKTTWAGTLGGQPLNGRPRKVALIGPENPVYQACARTLIAQFKAAGNSLADTIFYTLDLGSLSNQAASILSKLVDQQITTVACACDPLLLVFLTSKAHEQGYFPEWMNSGAALTDGDEVGQIFDQEVWSHAAGASSAGDQQPFGSSLGYFAVKSVDPGATPAHLVDLLYQQVYLLAVGIQMAGPNLTPQTFLQGMLAYPGGTGPAGVWKFGPGQFTPQRRARLEWWNPNKPSVVNRRRGSWVAASDWLATGSIPSGPAPVFPNGPQKPQGS
jgi:hypothetical protein